MADYTWTNEGMDGDLDNLANYQLDGEPATKLPRAADTLDIPSDSIYSGTSFAGTLTGTATVYGGTFNGNISGSFFCYGGVFNGSVNGAIIYDGTFNGPVTPDTIYGWNGYPVFNDRVYFGNTLYGPSSPAVAPAGKVLTGTSNLGVAGMLIIPRKALTVGATVSF